MPVPPVAIAGAVYHLPFDDLKERSLKIRGLEARDLDVTHNSR